MTGPPVGRREGNTAPEPLLLRHAKSDWPRV